MDRLAFCDASVSLSRETASNFCDSSNFISASYFARKALSSSVLNSILFSPEPLSNKRFNCASSSLILDSNIILGSSKDFSRLHSNILST
ncbi:hypothetical protein PUN28_006345 [Cardiocondyla obscurior]|uniref:Uncharacterized protein n=1 Tax=Cardiocondyla obscurior TaxID=286306 RepID=A0AAW2GAT6_9HYME